MGYTTEFAGAFKVTPMVSSDIALRMNLWLGSRHYIRQKPIDMEDETLFGNPGKHGEYIIPSLKNSIAKVSRNGWDLVVAPWAISECGEETPWINGTASPTDEQITKFSMSYNTCPGKVPSLWSDFILVSDFENDCSWLMWNDSEKAYKMAAWGQFLWKVFQAMDYIVEGTISAAGEDDDDRWHMTAAKGSFFVDESGYGCPTYDMEAQAAWERSRKQGYKKAKENMFPPISID